MISSTVCGSVVDVETIDCLRTGTVVTSCGGNPERKPNRRDRRRARRGKLREEGGNDADVGHDDPIRTNDDPSEATPVIPRSQFQPPLLPSNPQPCMTSIPLVVTTDNRTTSNGDLCATFNRVLGSRSSASLRNNMALGAGMFELHVRLLRLGSGKITSCNLMVEVLSASVALGVVSGAARVAAADKLAAVTASMPCSKT